MCVCVCRTSLFFPSNLLFLFPHCSVRQRQAIYIRPHHFNSLYSSVTLPSSIPIEQGFSCKKPPPFWRPRTYARIELLSLSLFSPASTLLMFQTDSAAACLVPLYSDESSSRLLAANVSSLCASAGCSFAKGFCLTFYCVLVLILWTILR